VVRARVLVEIYRLPSVRTKSTWLWQLPQ
jgi:hypothetical protein